MRALLAAIRGLRSATQPLRLSEPELELELIGNSVVNPLVTVIVPTRNQQHSLRSTVLAILEQDLQGVDLIVCDDASDDETPSTMRQLIESGAELTYCRLRRRAGPAGARNVGLAHARGRFVAFTDGDCRPTPGWLRSALSAFDQDDVGVVQGRTEAGARRQPLFEHHVESLELDGSFATANVVYRRQAIEGLQFDQTCWRWEDTDLGWRVIERGWAARFAPQAFVHHDVIPLSPLAWLLWSRHYSRLPAIVRRHPGYRAHLLWSLWSRRINPPLELAVLGVVLTFWWPPAVLLVIPYAIAFLRSRGLRGRFPPAKFAAHLVSDLVGLAALAYGSARQRSLVL